MVGLSACRMFLHARRQTYDVVYWAVNSKANSQDFSVGIDGQVAES